MATIDMDSMPPPSSQMPPPSSQMPPPSSQSHFEKFDNFVADNNAPFEDEFSRLASSQQWASGSQEFQKQRTIALRSELKLHYFSQSQDAEDGLGDIEDRPLTDEERLNGFQALCEEVGIPTHDTIEECEKNLKKTLVNIVDLIDTRRTGKEVKVWVDFDAFRRYTLKRPIKMDEAKKDGGILASLLQHIRFPRGEHRKSHMRKRPRSGVASGRVKKSTSQNESRAGARHLHGKAAN